MISASGEEDFKWTFQWTIHCFSLQAQTHERLTSWCVFVSLFTITIGSEQITSSVDKQRHLVAPDQLNLLGRWENEETKMTETNLWRFPSLLSIAERYSWCPLKVNLGKPRSTWKTTGDGLQKHALNTQGLHGAFFFLQSISFPLHQNILCTHWTFTWSNETTGNHVVWICLCVLDIIVSACNHLSQECEGMLYFDIRI